MMLSYLIILFQIVGYTRSKNYEYINFIQNMIRTVSDLKDKTQPKSMLCRNYLVLFQNKRIL